MATFMMWLSGLSLCWAVAMLVRVRATSRIRHYHIDRFYALNKRYIDAFFAAERKKVSISGFPNDWNKNFDRFEFDDYVMGYDEIFYNWRIWSPEKALKASYEEDIMVELLKL